MYRTESGGLFETEQEARVEDLIVEITRQSDGIAYQNLELLFRQIKKQAVLRDKILAYLEVTPSAKPDTRTFLLIRLGKLTEELTKYQSYNGPPLAEEQELVIKIALLNNLISELR